MQDTTHTNKAKKVLLVEDDAYLRDLYKQVLEEQGYEMSVGVDGEEGLIQASKGGYDLILLDVMMPKMNGMDVLKNLFENPPKMPNKKIVLLTNLGYEDTQAKAATYGCTEFIVKSDIDPGILIEKVKQYVS
jgi:DNA-binding response OmpR family regulator